MVTGGAAAGLVEEGLAAYRSGDYAAAALLWRPLAEQGYADAQYNLGCMYREGQGVLQDNAEAVKWFFFAAEQGLAAAQFNLGLRYAFGEGVPQDYVLAHMWSISQPRGIQRRRSVIAWLEIVIALRQK